LKSLRTRRDGAKKRLFSKASTRGCTNKEAMPANFGNGVGGIYRADDLNDRGGERGKRSKTAVVGGAITIREHQR